MTVATVFPRYTRTLPFDYVNQRYLELKRKESQALLSEEGSRIFAQHQVDAEPVFGQIKACLSYKRCQLRG
ncbi:hypothetical protein ACM0P9_07325 [Streptococcus pluranimalium]